MSFKRFVSVVALFALGASPLTAPAAVTAEEAARLQTELTPFGAERAGNRDGSIPAWAGGYTTASPGYRSGQPRPDPFADEPPRFRITAANADRYAAHLSDGVLALLKRFPTYRLDVYPSHRTAAAPAWVYENTVRNATRAQSRNDGLTVVGAYGGIPFPIPKSGREAMWNHLLAWKGEAAVEDGGIYLAAGGKPTMTAQRQADFQYPYYYRNGSVETFRGIYSLVRYVGMKPPNVAGEAYVVHEPIDQARQRTLAWAYLVGQRRVRPVPTLAYDARDSSTSGVGLVDEVWLFKGALDHYEWRLLGKQEMFVPYNNNRFHLQKIDQVLGARHLNPNHVRWERHRVWVVEGRLAPGKRHLVAKRRLYLDEDTWLALLYDGWDGEGRLWHVAHPLPLVVPELPAVVSFPDVLYDLVGSRYTARYLLNESRLHYRIVPRRPEDFFSPSTLAGEGVR